MSDNKMREAFEKAFPLPSGIFWNEFGGLYDALPGCASLAEEWQAMFKGYMGALAQQPESDYPWIELAACLYQACGTYDLPERILDVLSLAQRGEPFGHLVDGLLPVFAPQPTPQVPTGFNPLAYNRKTGEWMYVNHAGEWHLCPCPADRTLQVPEEWRTVLKNLLDYAWRQICMHEDTHRGGSIWEICDQCGARWADDEGGRPDFATPPEIEAAEELLAAPSIKEKPESGGE